MIYRSFLHTIFCTLLVVPIASLLFPGCGSSPEVLKGEKTDEPNISSEIDTRYKDSDYITIETYTEDVEEQVEEGNVLFESEPEGAQISFNGRERGITPLYMEIASGSYRVEVDLSGHQSLSFWLDMGREEEKVITCTPPPKTGIFSPLVSPEGTAVYIDGTYTDNRRIRLPVGRYRLRAERFGYLPFTSTVRIKEGEVSQMRIQLEEASPRLSALTAEKEKINFDARGFYGSTRLSFEINKPADIRYEVIGPEGSLLHSERITDKNTNGSYSSPLGTESNGQDNVFSSSKKYSFRWPKEGKTSLRNKLITPEREKKTVTLRVTADFEEGPTLSEETKIVVDPMLQPAFFLAPFGYGGALFCATPPEKIEGFHGGVIPFLILDGLSGGSETTYSSSPRFMSSFFLHKTFGNEISLNLSTGMETSESIDNAFFIAGEGKIALFPESTPQFFRSSAALQAGYRFHHRRNSFSPSTHAQLSFPTRIGGGTWAFVIEPKGGVLYSTEDHGETEETLSSPDLGFSGGTGGAFTFRSTLFSAALSASIAYETIAPRKPRTSGGGEINFMVPNTGFIISIYIAADFSDGFTSPIPAGGIGASTVHH